MRTFTSISHDTGTWLDELWEPGRVYCWRITEALTDSLTGAFTPGKELAHGWATTEAEARAAAEAARVRLAAADLLKRSKA